MDSVTTEADPNPIGLAALDDQVRNLLTNRLRVTEWSKTNEVEPVVAPIVVLGMPRTGTTALSQLLAHDPENRSPCWPGRPSTRCPRPRRPATTAIPVSRRPATRRTC